MASQLTDKIAADRTGITGSITVADILSHINIDNQPLYEYREIWAEENGGISNNTAEWSYGNGAVGYIGLVVDAGWEVVEMAFEADSFAATSRCQIDFMSYNTASNSANNAITNITMANSTDGGGSTNNAHKHVVLDTPVPVPAGKIGFCTRTTNGTISDVRVYARLRRQNGTYVKSVSFA